MNLSLKSLLLSSLATGFFLSLISGCATPKAPDPKVIVDQSLDTYYQGEKLERQKELEQARDAYLASIEASPRPRAYYRLAEVQYHLGQIDDARKSAEQAVRLSPTYRQPQLFLQRLQTEQSGQGTAPTPVETSAAIKSENAGETGETVSPPSSETIDSVQIPSSETTSVPNNQGVPLAKPTSPTAETSAAAAAKPLDPDSQALFNEAKQAATAGDWERALSLNQRVLDNHPDNPAVLYNLGYASFQQGRLSEAEEAFRRVIELTPGFADVYNDLGVTLEALGRSGEAIASYERAIEIGQHADANFNLALLKEKMGDYKEAITLYENYLKTDKVSAYAQYAQQRIHILRRNAF